MKKILSILAVLCFLFISMNCFGLDDGLYEGNYFMYVDNPTQCASSEPGYARIINLEGPNVVFQLIVFWENDEIVLEERQCTITGKTMHCPCSDQIIDFSIYGFDAVLTNEANHGISIIKDYGFRMNNSVRRNTCEGSDCPIIEQWMGANFPCNIGSWITEYTRISD